MVNLWLVSALVEKIGNVIGHRARVERAGSHEEAEAKLTAAVEVDGFRVTSIDSAKLDLAWYRD